MEQSEKTDTRQLGEATFGRRCRGLLKTRIKTAGKASGAQLSTGYHLFRPVSTGKMAAGKGRIDQVVSFGQTVGGGGGGGAVLARQCSKRGV